MQLTWKSLQARSPEWLKAAALALAGLAALYVGALQPLRNVGGIAERRATGLAQIKAISFDKNGPTRFTSRRESAAAGIVGGVPGGVMQMASVAEPAASPLSVEAYDAERKTVRTDSLDLIVQRPADAAEGIRQLANRLGGFLVTSELSGDQDVPSASLTIRVPAARFEEARAEVRKLGLRLENERLEAQDVTLQYVDQEARLRNLRAEETQYLAILKHASAVKDTLAVSEKLSEVRGEIEQQQAEFNALSKQVETVAITVSLRAEADTQVFGLHWRPLYQLKIAAREGLNGLADYASTMASVLFYLPAVLLWMATILVGLAGGYRILRWAGRMLFARPKPALVNS